MSPLQVCFDGRRYGGMFVALRQARRAWHRLDAALVRIRTECDDCPDLHAIQKALGDLDRYLARLDGLLAG